MSLTAGAVFGRSPIRLADDPALSPDGQTLAFAWRGDIWTVAVTGGVARPLTQHTARDSSPSFSPDGRQIAFLSEREPGPQIFLMPATGGTPQVATSHSEGYALHGWYPDGSGLLANAARDYFTSPRATQRFFRVPVQPAGGEQLLFDDYGRDGSVSPDGQRLLFTREGEEWWRKGYRGSRASQIWVYDFGSKEFQPIVREETSARWPLWRPDGKGFYFVSARSGSFNLWEYDLASGRTNQFTQLTRFEDDAVVFPCVSRDGSTIVFRHLFDFYRYHPGKAEPPLRLEIVEDADATKAPLERRAVTQASAVAFSDDGLEIAFIAGGDLWVMDTELREPRAITHTPEEERDPIFAPDGQSILFTSDQGGQCDIWRVRRGQTNQFWWQNEQFVLEKLTDDPDLEQDIQWNHDGTRLAFIKGAGDLVTMDPNTRETRRVLAAWSVPEYQWSPDGKWFVVARDDADFNSDIWILPSDGSGTPMNISKHPDNEASPVWSPDGKMIAFTGRRLDTEVDIFYVWLGTEDDARTRRERTVEKAIEKMNKARHREKEKPRGERSNAPKEKDKESSAAEADASKPESKGDAGDAKEEPARKKRKTPSVSIDFDRIHERVRQISIPNSTESGLMWSPDSKKLAFTATVEGKRGTYTVEFPDELKPKLLSTETGVQGRWIENQIVWLSSGNGRAETNAVPPEEAPARGGSGAPGSLTESGKATNYTFRVLEQVDLPAKHRAAFDLAWRTMRDQWYDEHLGNRNWEQIRRKYSEAASEAPDTRSLGTVISLMLGELNGSHLGFTPTGTRAEGGASSAGTWQPVTAHLGVRWDATYRGPGLRIRDVFANGPADRKTNGLVAGEIVLTIDGTSVDIGMDIARVLNGSLNRDVHLHVRNEAGGERDVVVRPVSYAAVRPLLYEKWIRDNRGAVDRLSDNALGYLHVEGMNWPSFQKFERELYAAGAGKDGLIIDVRDNGGGFTADHLLTALTQPRHAITVPRGGQPGYPQDRQVYATWNKPVVVLCNQNSFSNAEIFSHAIKTLHRGKLVGVATAGGVISTGGRPIMDVGFLRLPFRGWFLPETGEDMELNGAVPDAIVWPVPGDLPAGKDAQLEKAVSVLQEEVVAWKKRPAPALRKSSERANGSISK